MGKKWSCLHGIMSIIMLVCVSGTYWRCDDKPQSAQKQYFEEKWKIKNLVERRQKLEVTMHIYFSRQIQYKMLLLITVHPFWRWWVDNLKHSKENDFPKKLTFQSNHSACAWFRDWSTANNRNLFPFQASHTTCLCFVYLAFLTKH